MAKPGHVQLAALDAISRVGGVERWGAWRWIHGNPWRALQSCARRGWVELAEAIDLRGSSKIWMVRTTKRGRRVVEAKPRPLRSYLVNVIGKSENWAKTIHAPSAGAAKYSYLLDLREVWDDAPFSCLTCRSLGLKGQAQAESAPREGMTADEWNDRYPLGTPVRYWPGLREIGSSREGETRSKAWVVCGTPMVLCTGYAGGIALTHVEVLNESNPI